MFRRVALGVLVAGAFSACGRQITPSPSTANLAGRMVVKFNTNGALDFTNVTYIIIFNTTGTGGSPEPQGFLTGFLNYSYSFDIGAETGGIVAGPALFEYAIRPGSGIGPQKLRVPLTANSVVFQPNTNSTNTQFEVTFQRSQLYDPLHLQTPAPPGSTPTPSPSPTGTASTTPTPSGSASPTPSGSASPTASPTAIPTGPTPPPNFSTTNWCVNFFTLDTSGAPLDSLGIGGPTDNSYQFCFDPSTTSVQFLNRSPGYATTANPGASIQGGEIDNYQ